VTNNEPIRVSTMESVLALLAFFDEVGANLDTYTQMVRLRPMDVASDDEFRQWIQRAGPGWAGMTYRSSDGSMKAIALPVEDVGPDTTRLLPFVEVHQAMSVRWLTTVWRTRQLLLAADWAWSNDLIVPAAASARGSIGWVKSSTATYNSSEGASFDNALTAIRNS
jgi:hypothetical protein